MVHGQIVSSESSPSPNPKPVPTGMVNATELQRQEAAAELFAIKLADQDVSLRLSGSWKGTATASWGLALTPLGLAVASDNTPLLFAQETDLTLSLWIQDRWFVETSFLDDYKLNTYRAGYQGKEHETVQYVGVGNTGLDFPNFPYLDLGGDTPNSFGVYGKFGSGDLTLHALLRYDSALRQEKVFQGSRERTFQDLQTGQTLRGRFFILPDSALDGTPTVYLEDPKGNLTGSDGRMWRKALAGEYSASGTYGIVELAATPPGRLAVAYSLGGNSTPWTASLGTYGTAATPGTGFLGSVQSYFAPSGLNLQDYPQPGDDLGNHIPGAVTIGGTAALVLYEGGAFSPFEGRSRYSAPVSSSATASSLAELVRPSTGERLPDYDVEILSPSSLLVPSDRPVYELSSQSNGGDIRSPQRRWPLVALTPEAYVPGGPKSTADLALRFVSYGSSGAMNIGTDVVPGSVQVYRNGIVDSLAVYDKETGTVTLESPVGIEEIVRISYLKRADERRFGSVAAGFGAVYQSDGPFAASGALGLRWNVSGDAYSEEGSTNPGTIGFGGRLAWTYPQFSSQITAGLAYEQRDTTGLYRIAGMEGAEIDMGLPSSGYFPSETPRSLNSALSLSLDQTNRAVLVFRNYLVTDLLGFTTLKPIEWQGAPVVVGQEGPYPVWDDSLQVRVLAGEFSLTESQYWTGFQIPIGDSGTLLAQAKQIIVPFRFYNFASNTNVEVDIQYGTLAQQNSGGSENPNLTVYRTLYTYTYGGSAAPTVWTSFTLTLNDEDRRKLQNATFLRIVVRQTTPASGTGTTGRFLIAPPVAVGAVFRSVTVSADQISAAPDPGSGSGAAVIETADPTLRSAFPALIDRLHPSGATQRVLREVWQNLSADQGVGADGRTPAIPLLEYRNCTFFLKGPAPTNMGVYSASTVHLIVARRPESYLSANRNNEVALEASIPASVFSPGQWSLVEVRYGGANQGVYVDGQRVPGALLTYRPTVAGNMGGSTDSGGAPPTSSSSATVSSYPVFSASSGSGTGYAAVFLTPPGGGSLADGTFSIDELTLQDPAPDYRANLGGALSWKVDGPVVSYRGKPLMTDLSVQTAMESAVQGDPLAQNTSGRAAIGSRSAASVTVLGAFLSGNLGLQVSTSYSAWNGGHTVILPLGNLSTQDTFSASPSQGILLHRLSTTLSSPFQSSLQAETSIGSLQKQRSWQAQVGYSRESSNNRGLPLNTQAGALARWTTTLDQNPDPTLSYGELWTQSLSDMVIDPGWGVRKRETGANASFGIPTKPVGFNLRSEGSQSAALSTGTTDSSTQGTLEFPFTIGSFNGTLRQQRTVTRSLGLVGPDVSSDLARFGEALYDYRELWALAPLYTLWDGELDARIQDLAAQSSFYSSTRSLGFTDGTSFNLGLPRTEGPWGLLIPASLSSGINRTLQRQLDTLQDTLSLTQSLDFTAMNLFGAFGTNPVFQFYKSDEFSHHIEGSWSWPQSGPTVWRIASSQNAGFYGFLGSQLMLTHTLTTTNSGWSDALRSTWTVPADHSLLGLIYDRITDRMGSLKTMPAVQELAKTKTERLRRESLETVADFTGTGSFTLTVGHESIVRIPGRLALSAFGNLELSRDYGTKITTIQTILGTSLKITY